MTFLDEQDKLNWIKTKSKLRHKLVPLLQLLSTDRFELRKFRNIGKSTIDGINRKLKDFGIETPDFRTW